jgi:hypothetical protein
VSGDFRDVSEILKWTDTDTPPAQGRATRKGGRGDTASGRACYG